MKINLFYFSPLWLFPFESDLTLDKMIVQRRQAYKYERLLFIPYLFSVVSNQNMIPSVKTFKTHG